MPDLHELPSGWPGKDTVGGLLEEHLTPDREWNASSSEPYSDPARRLELR